MQGLKVKFEETFAALWPEFNYRTRAYNSTPKSLAKEFKAFRFGADPPAIEPPSSKTSSKTSTQSALPSWRVMYDSPQIKQIADPAKMTGSPRVPNAEGDLDPPQPQPEA